MLDRAPLDLVDVTPRPNIRAPIAMMVLEAGKHLLQPLPFAMDLAQADLLLDRSKATAVVANVENLHRQSPAFWHAKALIDERVLGDIYSIQASVRTNTQVSPPPGWVYTWNIDPNSGASVLRNFGAHLLHTLIWFFGDISSVTASLSIRQNPVVFSDGSTVTNGTVDTAFVLTQYRSGATGSLHASWCTPGGEGVLIDAIGSRGRLMLRADNNGPENAKLFLSTRDRQELREVALPDAFDDLVGVLVDIPSHRRGYSLAAMCHRMAEAIQTDRRDRSGPDFTEAHRVMNIVEAAYRSSEERRSIAV